MNEHPFWIWVLAFFGIILGRYFVVAGGSYWLLYARPQPTGRDGTPPLAPISERAIRDDIQLSVIAAAVFALATAGVLSLQALGLTRLYARPDLHGWWYLGLSYAVVLILQDGYFYATHRLFHHPALFRWLHEGHHRSRQPTPWTSFAFDPIEAVVQALFLVGVVFVIPLHAITLVAVLCTMTVWAVVNHLGLDRLPLGFPHHWLGRWFIGPAHHSLHHRRHGIHFGLYFTFWDQVCGTEDPAYARSFELRLNNGPA
ncbi:sterol desaturase family protein [Synechococcus sp. Tobar12-5m-g]|uniref:sterol desaturase family protein n=1 Tax=unclassified Synechococcus TaxID=2626047 RepID=UPI0020CC5707|nr:MULTISPECIES: sterol desaturase family protein [unclassified Synechococcus]MCP9772844.1 sterol desaturase family protein [Synechococcus sp. Tobar12-5m-g]MCP9873690.1 sterol desaturase family protein [Synechococcus sp. Cruz CV-v-12]